MRPRAAVFSAAIHTCAVLIMLFLAIHPPASTLRVPDQRFERIFAPRPYVRQGGGGQRSNLPAQKGRAPLPVIRRIFVPPSIPPQQSKLPLEQALLEAPAINVAAVQIGDPGGIGQWPSGGPGGPGGFGGGPARGIGDGDGNRLGGVQTVARSRTRVTRGPVPLFQPEPEYSDEARKAHYQGTVVLALEIDASGMPRKIRVIRGLGLGLDEKAIQAVERWRFRPAYSGSQPVSVDAQVEVSFHLL